MEGIGGREGGRERGRFRGWGHGGGRAGGGGGIVRPTNDHPSSVFQAILIFPLILKRVFSLLLLLLLLF